MSPSLGDSATAQRLGAEAEALAQHQGANPLIARAERLAGSIADPASVSSGVG